ncbi:MAG: type 4b pilus protein PilO2 [Rhodobacteraceae bacterium]|nr:type 4b pilus protein PilO2 [Paracoccaceae bacterium]
MPPNRLRIGSRQAAAGILWQPARSGLSLRDQVILASGMRSDLDLFTTFGDGRQFGFASSDDGSGSGMMAAATAIDTASLGSTWLATFELAEGGPWWIVAMRSGLIYEDQVFEEQASAMSTHEDLSSAPEWEHIVVPEGWQIPNAETRLLKELLDAGNAAVLRPINRLRRHVTATMALCCLCVLGYASWKYLPGWLHQAFEPAPLPVQETAVETLELPWVGKPNLEEFLALCSHHIDRLYVPAAGWRNQPMSCTPTIDGISLSTQWRRKDGRAALVKAAVLEQTGLRVRTDCLGQCIKLTKRLQHEFGGLPTDDPPWPSHTLETVLTERFQTLGLQVKLSRQEFRLPVQAEPGAHIQQFGHHEITFATSAAIDEYGRLLSDVPALVPVLLAYAPDSKSWTATARAYHMPPSQFWRPTTGT